MELSKKELMKNKKVTSQQALVDRLAPRPRQEKRFTVPGGATLWDDVSRDDLEAVTDMVYTWLRAAGEYTGFRIHFASDPSKHNAKKSKIDDLEIVGGQFPEWATPGGKKDLAERLARVICKTKDLVSIEVDKNQIVAFTKSTFSEKAKDWEPHIVFDLKRPRYSA